jgi:capsular exopolysaccharide synthesis family protein
MRTDEHVPGPSPEVPYPAEGDGVSIREYWQVIRKRTWVILFVAALVVGSSVLFVLSQQNIYQAEATLEIRTETPRVLGADIEPVINPVDGARYFSTTEYFETQYLIIGSRSVADRVVESLQLAENLEFLGLDDIDDPDDLAEALDLVDPAQHLMALTTVEPVMDSHIVRIQVEHSDPALAALLANTIAQVYIERNEYRQLRGTNQAFEWLASERTALRQRVETAEDLLLGYRQTHNMHSASLESRQQHLSTLLGTVNARLVAAETDVQEIRSERRHIREVREAGDVTEVPIPAVIDNALIQSLKEHRESLVDELSRLRSRYGERHHEVEGLNESLAQVSSAIEREIEAVLDSYDIRLGSADARRSSLSEERDEILAEMQALSRSQPNYSQLERDILMNSNILTIIERRYAETDLYRRQYDVSNIEVLDSAVAPEIPIRPRKKLVVLVAMMLGLLLGVGFAFLLEVADNTIRTQEDVEQVLGFTFLGVVPSIRASRSVRGFDKIASEVADGNTDLFIHQHPKSSVAECCRSIRTNLHFMSTDHPLKTILVTSAGPREGKTSTAISLATVMAQANNRVLLVDTDMRRPRIHKAFDLANRVGLTSLILGEVDYDTAIRETVVPNLDVLPCGPIPPNPTELMHTSRFRDIVDGLKNQYDRIIFDSPPVIAVADAMILGNAVDGALFVIKTGHTTREVVRRAKELLEGINARLLGAILNDLNLEDRAYRYHYYYSYYYRYGQYYQETEDGAIEGEVTTLEKPA